MRCRLNPGALCVAIEKLVGLFLAYAIAIHQDLDDGRDRVDRERRLTAALRDDDQCVMGLAE